MILIGTFRKKYYFDDNIAAYFSTLKLKRISECSILRTKR